jgi:septal ring factor EnvC (AmiA/AmiB activator)
MTPDDDSLRDKLARQGEDAVGRLAQDLLENPLVSGALTRAFEAREKAAQAQQVAMGALNLPSAGDIERLTRRLRSVSQRLEGIEDGVDRLEDRIADVGANAAPAAKSAADDGALDQRLGDVEDQLAALTREIIALRRALPSDEDGVHRQQARLEVDKD